MDKMTLNMIAGAVLSALLVIFGMNTLIDIVYPTGGSPEAPIETAQEAAPAGEQPAEAATPFPVLLASANAEAGASQAKKCVACHSFDQGGANKIGPNLHDIVGKPVAGKEGFAYSPALKEYGGNWDYERLRCFIEDPQGCVAGTKMAFAGIKKETDLADVIVYLRSVTPDAPPLPAAEEAAAPAGEPPAAPSGDPAAAPASEPAAVQKEGAAAGPGPVTGGGSGPGQTEGTAPSATPQAQPSEAPAPSATPQAQPSEAPASSATPQAQPSEAPAPPASPQAQPSEAPANQGANADPPASPPAQN